MSTAEHRQRQRPPFRKINPAKIKVNPLNPRGPNVADNDPSLERLIQSVHDLGILVPLIVTPIHGTDTYQLIDGERRFHAARSLRLKSVPAYVIYKDYDDPAIRRTMFHIHMNIKLWAPAQQCHAAEDLYKHLVGEFGDPDDEAFLERYASKEGMDKTKARDTIRRLILREFIEETGTNPRTAKDRMQFLRWPKGIKQDIYERNREDAYWYVCEIEDKIIEPAQRNYPEYFEKVSVNKVREFLFKKLEEGVVKAATEAREAAVITRSRITGSDRQRALDILDHLVTDVRYSFSEAKEDFIQYFPQVAERKPMSPVAMLNAMTRLASSLNVYDPGNLTEAVRQHKLDLDQFKAALKLLLEAAEALLDRLEE